MFRTGHKASRVLSMICSLLVALRGCRRGRWHDGGKGKKERIEGIKGKASTDSASTQEQ